ncbi:hypothetical protein V1512DRAFT_256073 [Lipomyces arxii]|uniref:uncharacterized protein n=1 Tax=Lipomyces arxii TaxID=56418 RepID=UPI0034CDE3E2
MTSPLTAIFPPSNLSVLSGSANNDTKTLFTMHALASFLSSTPTASALWIDTTSSFPVFLFRDILSHYAVPLDRMALVRTFDVTGLIDSVRDLNGTYSAVVVDSITAPFAREMAADQVKGHAKMAYCLSNLRTFTHSYHATTILINSSVEASKSDTVYSQFSLTKPSLGPTFLYYVDFCSLVTATSPHQFVFEIIADRTRATEGHLLNFNILRDFSIEFPDHSNTF